MDPRPPTWLQDNTIPLRSKQLALTTITQLIQLPPRISQLTRCSLLKAAFNTIFGSFIAADAFKGRGAGVAQPRVTHMDALSFCVRTFI